MEKQAAIYMLSNKKDGTLYIGVTSNLIRRIGEHKNGMHNGFTKKYNLHHLVYYELYNDMYTAISREKQLKGGSRKKKIKLINENNPEWIDLYNDIL